MTDFRDRFELQLTAAMAREFPAAQPKRRRGVGRRGVLSLAIGFATAAAALAATHPWSPAVGTNKFHESAPTQSRTAPPASELSLLGVLRRQQSPADRGRASEEALRYISPRGNQGVRLEYVRSLDGGAATLVPVQRADENREAATVGDALCVFYADPAGDGGARSCWSAEDVRAGRARGELGTHVYGLVPDGVATVELSFEDGSVVRAPVGDNFFDAKTPREQADQEHAPIPAKIEQLRWLDQNDVPSGPPSSG
jgi:hypothetical protein